MPENRAARIDRGIASRPTHWVVELCESGVPGRWIYEFGYVRILTQPAIVERIPADNC